MLKFLEIPKETYISNISIHREYEFSDETYKGDEKHLRTYIFFYCSSKLSNEKGIKC